MGIEHKKTLRSQTKKILRGLDERWIRAASKSICSNLNEIFISELSHIEHVLGWMSFFPGEADLSDFLLKAMNTRQVYLPKVNEDRHMSFISVGDGFESTLSAGYRGMMGPEGELGMLYDPRTASNTAMLVPGLAFDRSGARLGRGKGYYDTFLSNPLLSNCILIGICFELQLVERVPTEAHDVAMNLICCEREVFKAER